MSTKNPNLKYAQFLNCNQNTIAWLELHPSPESYDTTATEHVVDYLKFKDFYNLEWASWPLLTKKADKWSRMLQQNVATIDEEYGEDIETVLDFQDGFRIVKLISENSYKREGNLMFHCVSSYYARDVEVYSLRDQWNKPHCTIEKDTQIKGKGNGYIIFKYIDYIVKFLEWSGMKVRDLEMKRLSYMAVPFPPYYTGKLYKNKYVLKDSVLDYGEYSVTENLNEARKPGKWLYKGSIKTSNSEEFPYICGIEGTVRATDTAILSLPSCTYIGGFDYSFNVSGSIYSYDESIISLPSCTNVGHNIFSDDESRISLPVCNAVGGDVHRGGKSTITLSGTAYLAI